MKEIMSGEMFGFKIINIFPDNCSEDEWMDFADAMAKILAEKGEDGSTSA